MDTRRFIRKYRLLVVFALLVTGWVCAGCGTEPDNESAKPWDAPSGWQNNSLPMMNQPH
jgi:hypothetical protein